MTRLVQADRKATNIQIMAQNTNLSSLEESGLISKGQVWLAKNKKKRLQWGHVHQNWMTEQQ